MWYSRALPQGVSVWREIQEQLQSVAPWSYLAAGARGMRLEDAPLHKAASFLRGIAGVSQPQSWDEMLKNLMCRTRNDVSREDTAEYSLSCALVYRFSTVKNLCFK